MTGRIQPAIPTLTVLCALAAPAAWAGPTLFVCDDPGSDLSVDSGFGAAPGVVQAFATVPQDFSIAFDPRCLSTGYTWVVGVVIQATRTGGSTTMPIAGVEITQSTMSGPPSDTIITSGPPGQVENVPIFPTRKLARLPVAPGVALLDFDDDGDLDIYISPRVSIDGDVTADQFLAYSRSGPNVPCFTGSQPGPVDEDCTDPPNGDPTLHALGIGLRTAAGRGGGFAGIEPYVLTDDPTESGSAIEFYHDLFAGGTTTADVSLFDDSGVLICSIDDLPRGTPAQCALSMQQVQQWAVGQLEFEIIRAGEPPSRGHIIPADSLVFADGFESGDTSAWTSSVP